MTHPDERGYAHNPYPAHDPYGGNRDAPGYSGRDGYEYAPAAGREEAAGYRRNPDGTGRHRMALLVHTIGDVFAAVLGLWILLYLLEANQGNVLVAFVHGMADWLAGWSQDIFTMETEGVRVLFNYGLPALIYLGLGHGAATWIRRF
ncbi:hypothetical protein [Streptomyces meridianus]|uniref:Uncharacterized protein n=1 Tax=Streptomyces meridianus TaxID=2938945 RepID=A0ABT0X3Z7_9ACTN|nr:hypothetical protein [Streptomyces meridianus]MCM2577261.1 hypothetical protein [Streptomyces meridianus]